MPRQQYATQVVTPRDEVLTRHAVRSPEQLAAVPSVALLADELNRLADAAGLFGLDTRGQFLALAERGLLGTEAALGVVNSSTAFVGDWVQNRVYEIEFDLWTDPDHRVDWTDARDVLLTEWRAMRTGWAAQGHLTDPELAAAMRAYSIVARTVYRLKPGQFHVGGRRLTK